MSFQGPQDPNQQPQPGPSQAQPGQPYYDPRLGQPQHGGATTFAHQQPPKKRRIWLWVLLGILALFLVVAVACTADVGGAVNSAVEAAASPTATSAGSEEPAGDPTEDVADEPVADPSEEASEEPEPEPEPTKKALSREKQNAVDKAESYLDFQAFSKKGLIKQLEFEGFDDKDAKFAADYINADWKDQAAKKAESYLETQSFSRSGLAKQLEFEGFTDDQVKYGVKKAYN